MRVDETPHGTPQKDQDDDARKAPAITDMEKVVLASNEKASIQELWREPPQIDFPVNTYRAQINIQAIHDEICDKAETLKDKIEKRRL